MNIPTEKVVKLCQSERFVEGLKQLVDECGMSSCKYNAFGPIEYRFKDGSSVGAVRAFIDADIIDGDDYYKRFMNNI